MSDLRVGSVRSALVLFVALLAACGGTPAPPDAADASARTEAGNDVAAMEASADVTAIESGVDVVSDAAVDVVEQDRVTVDAQLDSSVADSACDPVAAERTMPMGQCDGRGMMACANWARDNAGGNPNATAVCITAPSGCARADTCTNAADPSSCRCGGNPACAPGNVCVATGPTATCRPVVCR